VNEPARLPEAPHVALNQVPRIEVNRFAAELYLPLFWDRDLDGDQTIDPEELAVLWLGIEPTSRTDWVDDGAFSERFYRAYERIVERKLSGPPKQEGSAAEAERQALLRRELEQGRPTVIRTNLLGLSDAERTFARHIVSAARNIERIGMKQIGSLQLHRQIPEHDSAARAVFFRNQGPWCVAPDTESNANCNAVPTLPKRVSGLYPESIQGDPNFCDKLKEHPNGEALRHQFFAVRDDGGALTAVPYHLAYADEMKTIAAELDLAAKALGSDEPALRSYLVAAAKAFRDDSWEQADEAWAKMNVHNSNWYLRIGPDEVYFEPCSLKAGFHVSFARINQASLAWQNKLEPVKAEMEATIARLAGPPYQARAVSFHLPDFIDLVLNAGDSRDPHGGTIGQSLPNWGPVANEGRGRTVAMTNLGTDPDSREDLTKLASSMLCQRSMASFTSDPEPQLMDTVLHEAMHNLGPAHEYKVEGKADRVIFGGPLASMLEELKAQTGALYFTDWLAARGLIDVEMATRAHVRDVTWAFGHISRGMYTSDGKPRPYSQLAAIQLGWLQKSGALTWHEAQTAANDVDTGCMEIHPEKFPTVVEGLMKLALGIKARGDVDAAKTLIAQFVDVGGEHRAMLDRIKERWLRAPKASYVYAVEL
jgi:hypothetical protein